MANLHAQTKPPLFKVIAFYTAKNDLAHISFVHEANKWFPQMAELYNFSFTSTNNWNDLNEEFLSHYQVVIFLDTRPERTTQRDAFKKYMDNGGAFIGFHFAGFALNNSAFPQNWDWYHNTFIGAGQYKSNT
ncbi:MAG TPA: ThuA domain-containing protein, partial [Chitinophagaceae bacterium]|nr:ThuA domain-containing protein [Chitinophagaceae bacterium]